MLWLLLLQVWASCLWLGHSEVVKNFTSCPQFFYQNSPPNNNLQPQNPAWICQCYKNGYFFATLYNKTGRIPVYSAYKYEPASGKGTHRWMVEPQLISPNLPKEMKRVSELKKDYDVKPKQLKESQAVNADYKNLTGLDRGHLNPNAHHNTSDSRNATFTLTNAVPQNSTLNRGNWRVYEKKTMTQESQDCINTTYVITGAVPGNKFISNGRVNIPSHIWSGACCQTNNGMKTWAAIAANNQSQVTKLTLGQLEGNLTRLYGNGQVLLFHSNCPR
ncbi:ENDD1 protein, partial [Neodrepanis coruscans]|nr:ENDD1 protein [Neodrepanis coruscans]